MDEKYKLSEGHSLPNVLSKWWPIVKKDLQTIIGFVNQHITGEGDRHKAEDVDYNEELTLKAKVDKVDADYSDVLKRLSEFGDTITDLGMVEQVDADGFSVDSAFIDVTASGIYKFRGHNSNRGQLSDGVLIVNSAETSEGDVIQQIIIQNNRITGRSGSDPFELLYAPIGDGKIYTSYLPTIPINKGGTNATTAEEARANLGAASQEDFDALKKPVTATSTDGVKYTATVDGVTELFAGLTLTIIPDTRSTNVNVTLDVNGLGAKTIRWASNSYTNILVTPMNSNWMGANRPVTLMYNGTYWVTTSIQGVNANYINTGTLPIARGGTGATTVEEALKNLGLDSLSGGGITDISGVQEYKGILSLGSWAGGVESGEPIIAMLDACASILDRLDTPPAGCTYWWLAHSEDCYNTEQPFVVKLCYCAEIVNDTVQYMQYVFPHIDTLGIPTANQLSTTRYFQRKFGVDEVSEGDAWESWEEYSGAVANLKDRVKSVETDLAALEARVVALEAAAASENS